MKRLGWLSVFAITMAYLEAVIVMHLRLRYYPDHPLLIFPMSAFSGQDYVIEVFREAATILMLLSVAVLSSQRQQKRSFLSGFAAFVFSFGLWDIFYYLWLKVIMGWPVSWHEWDILFLIPRPWFGPWLTAAMIALLFVIWGAWVLMRQSYRFRRWQSGLFFWVLFLIWWHFCNPHWYRQRSRAFSDRYFLQVISVWQL